jgi:hypothetical protein
MGSMNEATSAPGGGEHPDVRGRAAHLGTLFLLLGAFLPFGVLTPPEVGAQLRVLPQLGLYAPLGDLGEVRENAGPALLDLGRQSSSLAFGLAVEVGARDAGTGVRAGVVYATTSTLPVVGPECPACEARANALVGGAAVVFRPVPPLLVVQPYFLVGGGVVRYGFDDADLREEGWQGVLRNQIRPQLQLGIGAAVDVAAYRPRIELNAHIARFEPGDGPEPGATADGDRQTNLFLTVSLPLGR